MIRRNRRRPRMSREKRRAYNARQKAVGRVVEALSKESKEVRSAATGESRDGTGEAAMREGETWTSRPR